MAFTISNNPKLLLINPVYQMNESDQPPLLGVDGFFLRFLEI
jgi:hypothetical protein